MKNNGSIEDMLIDWSYLITYKKLSLSKTKKYLWKIKKKII
jgi:hypothetical protein